MTLAMYLESKSRVLKSEETRIKQERFDRIFCAVIFGIVVTVVLVVSLLAISLMPVEV